MKVHILQSPNTEALATLRENLNPKIELTFGDQIPDPADYHILVGGVPTREFLAASPFLTSLVIPWAGLPASTRQLMLKFPEMSVHNLHHNAAPTGEMALALLFAAAKFLLPYDKALRSNNWTPRYQPNPSMLLHRKTALILGYGAIGKYVGKVLKAMDMRVLAVRRNLGRELEGDVEVYGLDSVPQLLPQAEVLVISLPGTPETEGLLGEADQALLPQGAVLVNVGRGPIVDAGALHNALRSGNLRGAGLDVWYNYPPDPESRSQTPPADYDFHKLENVVMSPHRGGGSDDSEHLRMSHLAMLLNSAAQGDSIPNRVDLNAGY